MINHLYQLSLQDKSLRFLACNLCWLIMLAAMILGGCKQSEEVKELQIGDTAPDFAVKDLSGNVIVLSSLGDSPVVLRFFETNCRFCKADTPVINTFYRDHSKSNLKVLYVGSFYESEKSLKAFAEEMGVPFPVAMDRDGRLADLYNIRAYPQTIFIGPQRQLLAAILGGVGKVELVEIMGKYLHNIK